MFRFLDRCEAAWRPHGIDRRDAGVRHRHMMTMASAMVMRHGPVGIRRHLIAIPVVVGDAFARCGIGA